MMKVSVFTTDLAYSTGEEKHYYQLHRATPVLVIRMTAKN